jgi:hypothetical protein
VSYIQTYLGKMDPLGDIDDILKHISIVDIAHSLAMKCRYGGHCRQFYSVAQHSVLVSKFTLPEFAMDGLLHDAEEAYFSDIPRPVKKMIPGWEDMIDKMKAAIAAKFKLSPTEPEHVKEIDDRILIDERKWLMRPDSDPDLVWPNVEPLGIKIKPWPWQKAESEFLNAFRRLGGTIDPSLRRR